MPTDVHPGDEATFAFSIVAPKAAGRFHFQWRMVQDGVGWFGEPSHDIMVSVDGEAGTTLHCLSSMWRIGATRPGSDSGAVPPVLNRDSWGF